MPNTYVALATATATGSQSTITFNSIPQIYTDLTLVWNGAGSAGNVYINLNGDTNQGNYTITRLYGNGTTASSDRSASFLMSIGTASNQTVSIMNLMNYSNTTTFKTALFRLNPTAAFLAAEVALWRNTAAVTQLDVISSSGNFTAGSTFNLYGIANADQGAAKATGGIITEDANYWYHTFGASGAFIPKQSLSCEYLMIAGGGGGGDDTAGNSGGGGAGGLLQNIGGTLVSLSATPYTVTIGAGGAGGVGSANGAQGGNTTFNSLTSIGGGYGARYLPSSAPTGGNGGSGGGAGQYGGGSATSGGSATAGQGYKGGDNSGISAAGGGGAGAAGANTSSNVPSGGGIGLQFSSFAAATGTGESGYYAGGGGGSAHSSYSISSTNAGGLGGGGKGHFSSTGAANAMANTGGGGGGGGENVGDGGNGGSGLVIIRYAK